MVDEDVLIIEEITSLNIMRKQSNLEYETLLYLNEFLIRSYKFRIRRLRRKGKIQFKIRNIQLKIKLRIFN